MIEMEKKRVLVTNSLKEEWTFEKLADKVLETKESVFVILNTRRKAFAFLNVLENKTNRKIFLRYSGLAPKDRKVHFDKIQEALSKKEDFILVATQGSEVGSDISFCHGFKESSDFDSVAQMKGRINRNCEYSNATLHIFKLCKEANNDGVSFGDNPQNLYRTLVFENNPSLLDGLSPEYCTSIAEQEIRSTSNDYMKQLIGLWNNKAFEDLSEEFSIIGLPMISVLIDADIYAKIKRNEYVPYADLQNSIVNLIYTPKEMDRLKDYLVKIENEDDDDAEEDDKKPKQKFYNLYFWKGLYDAERYGIFFDPIFNLIDPTKVIKKNVI